MSHSENLPSAADVPADAEIEQCIRTVVRDAAKKNEEVTVNLARTRAEEKLGLDAGFLKDNAQWKRRSKDLISAAFEEPSSPEVVKTTTKAPKAKPAPKSGTKRKSDETQASRKKQKTSKSSESGIDESELDGSDKGEDKDVEAHKTERTPESDNESALSDPPEGGEHTEAKQPNGKAAGDGEDSELSSVIDEPATKKKRQKKATSKAKPKPKTAKPRKSSKAVAGAEDDESDLSEVLDDPPHKKGRKKKSTSPGATSKPKPRPAAAKSLSPDEEEIKRLQSWLLKCGIRKLWHRELAPFGTDKEKIKHLKSMLDEAGMTGRFSAEKAKQIKESRELKAELEAATEFNKTWGHENGDSGEENGDDVKDGNGEVEEEKPAPGKRVRPKGFVDFGDSDEESE